MRRLFQAICLLGLSYFVWTQVSFSCGENYCAKVNCEDVECKGRLLKNATKCGCCDLCIKQLKKDSDCDVKQIASLPRAECGPGLKCSSEGKCVPMETECMKNLQEHIKRYGGNELTTGLPKPRCDNFGDYSPVQCKEGIMCFCVNPGGKRIFGTAPYSQKNNTHCNCSIEYEKFKDKLEDKTYFMRCTENGNFDSVQCTDTSCFCMDENGELDGRIVEYGEPLPHLKCFNSEKHSISYLTPCFKKLRDTKVRIQNYTANNIHVIGLEVPDCEIDGSYAPVQCYQDKCYCVDRNNKRYPETKNDRRNRYLMRCNCVRERELLRDEIKRDPAISLFSQYTCDGFGNYERKQCVASVCYCVDHDGFQQGESVLLSERYKLQC